MAFALYKSIDPPCTISLQVSFHWKHLEPNVSLHLFLSKALTHVSVNM